MSSALDLTLWVANVGLRGFSGEQLVDLILNGEKKMKYISRNTNCFGGQWIALREIKTLTKANLGRCRCAIQVSGTRRTQADHPNDFKEEWGWSDEHGPDGEAAEWGAHQILSVKLLFPPVFLQQSHQGKYWKLKTHDYMEESSNLLRAMAMSVENPTSRDLALAKASKTSRQSVRQDQKKLRDHVRQEARACYFSRRKNGELVYDCCRRDCVAAFGCSKPLYDIGGSQVKIITLLRLFMSLNRVTQRSMLLPRLIDRNLAFPQVRRRALFLERITIIQAYLQEGTFPIAPRPLTLTRVCHRFFVWVFAISNNKLYQPTLRSAEEFSVPMTGPRVRSWDDCEAHEFIRLWMKDYAEGHLHDPSSSNSKIILYVSTRAKVYEQYEREFREGGHPHFYPSKNGVPFLPSHTYFLRIWRTDSELRKIVLRKYMKFALCSQCTFIRAQKRVCIDPIQKSQLARVAQSHYTFVREERSSYYFRRNQAILDKNDYLSIIIDGADQAAYALPHFVEKDKSMGQQKLPVYLMGALVHGRASYAFTYLNNVKHGTNIVIECLHRIFCHIQRPIPPVLFLQVDNTCKQNKNKYMIGYLACLVHWKMFSQVYLSFLPVGHTHEDVDQYFSKIAAYLRSNDAYDRSGIAAAAANYHPHWARDNFECHTEHVERAANISDWIEGKLANFSCNVKVFQQYRIRREKGQTRIVVQGRSRCSEVLDDDRSVWKSMDEVAGGCTPVFAGDSPEPHQLVEEVPDAQLTRGARDQDSDIEDAGDEAKQDDRAVSQRKWVDKVCQGVQKVLQSQRGRLVFAEHPAAVKDLQKCMELLQSDVPLPFDWDVSIYENKEPPPRPTTRQCRNLSLLKESELSGDDDEGEEDVPSCPWLINSTCVIATDPPPFWAVVRIKGAATLRDGQFWKYPVCKLASTAANGEDEWAAPWKEDGPIREIFAKDILHGLFLDEDEIIIYDKYLVPIIADLRKVEQAGKRRLMQSNGKKKPALTRHHDDTTATKNKRTREEEEEEEEKEEEEKTPQKKGKQSAEKPTTTQRQKKRNKNNPTNDDEDDELKWNSLQAAAVERLKIEPCSLFKKRQHAYVIDRDTKTQTQKILMCFVIGKSSSSSQTNTPVHLQEWDLEFLNEKNLYAYPAWAIFTQKKIAENVFQEMLK